MEGKRKKSLRWTDYPLLGKIKRALIDNEYQKPTAIQSKAIKAAIVDKKNIFGAARTGSGKTLAYAIPIVNEILSKNRLKSSSLKKKLSRKHKKQEDFELVDGEMVSVEDMIVDKDDAGEDEEDEAEDHSEFENEVDEDEITCPEALILVPTRELAIQVKEEIDKICKYTSIKSHCIIGGLSQEKQMRQLNKLKPEIVIATPGRLYEIVKTEQVEHLNIQSVASTRFLVIDEADRMVQKGHFEEMLKVVSIINESKPFRGDCYPFNVYLFSATLTFLHELPDRLKNGIIAAKGKKTKIKQTINPEEHNKKNKILQMVNLLGIPKSDTRIIDLNDQQSFGRPSAEQLKEYRIHCELKEKDLYLYYFINHYRGRRILVFCNSKDSLRRLTNVLKWLRVDCMKLHSDMDQKRRLFNLEKFRSREDCVMVATDVAARGLDIKDLDCVIHYQVPKTCESYIHRSGRTARLDKCGVTLVLCEPGEVHLYKRLCNNINAGRELEEFDVDLELKQKLKDYVSLAQQCDILDHQIRSSKSEISWFLKAAKDCDIELDDDDMRHINGRGKMLQQDTEQDTKKKRKLAALAKSLDRMHKQKGTL